MDVYTAVQAYLEQDATGELTHEVELTKPEYKVFVSFKKENVSDIFILYNEINNYSGSGIT